jgi:hypothetical protein
MERIGARAAGGVDHGVDVEEVESAIALGRGHDDLHAEAVGGPPDPPSDLAAIRDEEPRDVPLRAAGLREITWLPPVRWPRLADDERV